MKERYLSPTILNANTLQLSVNENSENIFAAVIKKVLSNFGATIVGNLALSASMRRVFGAMNLDVKYSSLTTRKIFEEVLS